MVAQAPADGARGPSKFWTAVAVSGELTAGALLLSGLFLSLAEVLAAATMLVVGTKVHVPKGFSVPNGGFEYNLVLAIAALAGSRASLSRLAVASHPPI